VTAPLSHSQPRSVINFVSSLCKSEWTLVSLRQVVHLATGRRYRWVPWFARRLLIAFPEPPDFEVLLKFVLADKGYRQSRETGPLPIWTVFVPPRRMKRSPIAGLASPLPVLETDEALATWLGVRIGKLQWLADTQSRNRKHPEGPLLPYRHRWVGKPGGKSRLLEIPRSPLKEIQHKILKGILDLVPPHSAVHGFRKGRSVVTNAGLHCGKAIVIRFDLADFFPSISGVRIGRIFQTLGYPETVATHLSGLCTTILPWPMWRNRPWPAADGSDHASGMRLTSRHLPQGAPTSPAIANLAAYRLDRRLARLARAVDADYTRYADDLAFSGGEEFARGCRRFTELVQRIVEEEGYALHPAKTRIMRRSVRQQVAGIVVNGGLSLPRAEYDRLKAILTNCIRHGPKSQNRENHTDFHAHLAGKVARFAGIHMGRGRKLWVLFDRIVWEGERTRESE
jgi:RNA-directed DNA polymerase